MRSAARRRPGGQPVELNVIPLIDVVFFLLIFYVISTSFAEETAVPLHRPAHGGAAVVAGPFIAVAITAAGEVVVGTEGVARDGIAAAVRAARDAGGADRVVVVPDREVPTGLLLEVMDACAAGGASPVDVAADRDGG
jgi:biopolymer transport protein ExbD